MAAVATSAVDVATDVVVTTVDLTTDAITTGVDLASGSGEAAPATAPAAAPPAQQQPQTQPAQSVVPQPAQMPAAAIAAKAGPGPRHGNWCGMKRTGFEKIAIADRVDGFCRDHAFCKAHGIAGADCDKVLADRLSRARDRLDPSLQPVADALLAHYRQ